MSETYLGPDGKRYAADVENTSEACSLDGRRRSQHDLPIKLVPYGCIRLCIILVNAYEEIGQFNDAWPVVFGDPP
jgi:hypothetical protein